MALESTLVPPESTEVAPESILVPTESPLVPPESILCVLRWSHWFHSWRAFRHSASHSWSGDPPFCAFRDTSLSARCALLRVSVHSSAPFWFFFHLITLRPVSWAVVAPFSWSAVGPSGAEWSSVSAEHALAAHMATAVAAKDACFPQVRKAPSK